MDHATSPLLLATLALLFALLGGAHLGARWRRYAAARTGKAANRRGQRGERVAERLLRRSGYAPYARQVRTNYRVQVQGEDFDVQLQADYLVERDGRKLVAEVKTGTQAPRFEHTDTRRQLLEYQLAFEVDSVLLVDVEAGEVREVSFPLTRKAQRERSLGLWLAAFAGLAALALELFWHLRAR